MERSMAKTTRLFAILTAALVLLGVFVASSLPDGLEHVAEALGFAGHAAQGAPRSPFAGYGAAFVESSWLARVTAGIVGAGLIWAFGALLGRTLKKKGDS
jgi:cobalt/nickel transport protein